MALVHGPPSPRPPSLPPPIGSTLSTRNLEASLVLLAALVRRGLTDLVLCPGSRSGALAEAAGVLERHGLVLRTAVDERSAAFFALGLARATGRAVAVVTTSGTAVANLLPAVVEADYGAIPLLLITADRPDRLKGCGANQTVNQECFLAANVRWLGQADGAGLGQMQDGAIVELASTALAATQAPGQAPGPVHLNLAFDEPLHADGPTLLEVAESQVAVAQIQEPLVTAASISPEATPSVGEVLMPDLDQAGVVVAGPWRGLPQHWDGHVAALVRLQRRTGWPVLADGLSGLRGWPGLQVVHGYDILLAEGHGFPAAPQLLRLGSMPASRRLQQWITASGGPQLLISEGDPRNLDATGTASQQLSDGLASWLAGLPDPLRSGSVSASNQVWLDQWVKADQWLQHQLDRQLIADQPFAAASSQCSEPALARALSRCLPAGEPLMLASSSPVRDWESFAAADASHRPVDRKSVV